MAKDFAELAARSKAAWSADTHAVYDAASDLFTKEATELAARKTGRTFVRGNPRLAQTMQDPATASAVAALACEVAENDPNPTSASL